MHLEELVDLLDLLAGAGGDALLAAGLENVGVLALLARHRIDHRDLALEDLVVDTGGGDLVLHLGDAGHHAHQAADAAHVRHLLQAARACRRGRTGPCASSRRCARPFRRRCWRRPSRPARPRRPCRGCGRRCGSGWKSSSASVFSPVPISLIGLPVTARIDSAAPPRPSPSTRVSTMPVRPTRSSKARARLTASWPVSAVGDQQHFMRIGGGFDLGRLRHHLFVERGAAGGVEQHDVVAAELAGLQRAARDLRRLLACDDRQRRDVEIAAEHGELLHRRRAVDVERGHQHLALVALDEAARELGGGGGFAGALQADHHDRDRRHGIEIDGLAVGAERGDQLVMDDLDHHLAGRDRLDDGGADRLLAHLLGEAAHHIERDVGLEQRAAHLAHRGIDIGSRSARRAPSADRECHQAVPTDCRTMPLSPASGLPNTFAPEGAQRCRALTSGLRDRSAGRKESLSEKWAG